ncbi:acyltransferase [Kocuria rosea]|uniref:acyltransferase n=1 Tax=Kocuria rosea TaxID=1275 RepID=UPI000E0EC04C|nr:acyltransferase [Kocuria rosea]
MNSLTKQALLSTEPSIVPGPLQTLVRTVLRKFAVRGNVSLGTNVRAGRGAVIAAPHHLTVGDNVSVGPYSVVQVDGSIGEWTLIGMYVQIVGKNDHAIDEVGVPIRMSARVGDRAAQPSDAVHIGRDVWIGASSIVLSGVRIGTGSIIGAGSVVTKNIPDFSIAVGNPARVIGRRFSSDEDRSAHQRILNEL